MNFIELFETYRNVWVVDFLRYFITASAAYLVFWGLLKNKLTHRIIQKKFPTSRKMWHEFKYSLSTVFIFALIGTGIVTAQQTGYTQIYTDISEYGVLYMLGSFVLMVLIHDTYFYFAHRLMHHPKIFRHVHLVHHRSTNPSPWAAYSFHPIEAVVEAGIFPLIVFTIPVHSLVLVSFLVFMITRNVLGHLGMEIFPKWFVKNKFFNWNTTTTHHDLHHKHFHTNYGLYFTWWDNFFGTTDKKYEEVFEEVTSREPHKEIAFKPKTKSTTFTLLVLIFAFTTPTLSQSPVGHWQTFNEETGLPLAQIQIEESANCMNGTITKIFLQPWEGEDPICLKCPGEKKNQKVLGMTFLWDFEKDGNEYASGKILDPASGEIYSSKMWLENKNTLKVRGYAGPMNLFYRTQTWRLKNDKGDDSQITGIWETIDDTSQKPKSLIEISELHGKITGKILQIFLQPWEGKNPICLECPGNKKGQNIVGMTILENLKKEGTQWTNGEILDPANGQTYSCTMWMENEDTLKVRGYLGILYRTQTWKRVDATIGYMNKSIK